MTQNHAQQILALAQKNNLLQAKDLYARGIPHTYLGRMVDQGLLERVGRGLYRLSHSLCPSTQRSCLPAFGSQLLWLYHATTI